MKLFVVSKLEFASLVAVPLAFGIVIGALAVYLITRRRHRIAANRS